MSKHLSIKSWQEQKKNPPRHQMKSIFESELGSRTNRVKLWRLSSGKCQDRVQHRQLSWISLINGNTGQATSHGLWISRWVPRVWWRNGRKERSQRLTRGPTLVLGLSLQRWGGISEGLEVWLDLRPMWECDSHVLRLILWLCVMRWGGEKGREVRID